MTLFVPFVIVLASVAPALCQDDSSGGAFSPDQLDNLLAPVALYPTRAGAAGCDFP